MANHKQRKQGEAGPRRGRGAAAAARQGKRPVADGGRSGRGDVSAADGGRRERGDGASGAKACSACPVSRECGACQSIDVPYLQQLVLKRGIMVDLFEDLIEPELVRPVLGMADPFHYRNKVTSPYAPGRKLTSGGPGKAPDREGREGHDRRDGRGRPERDGGARGRGRANRPRREILCGMYAAGTHRIIPTDGCLIENEQAKAVILAVRDLMPRFGIEPYNENTGAGFLRHAVVRVGHTSGEVLVTLVTNGDEFPASKAFCRELVRRCPFVTTVVQNINERQTNVILGDRERVLYGPGFILDRLCGLSFRISSQSFYQVNSEQTEVLYDTALNLAGLTGAETVVDAYCGTGTIGLAAAKRGAAQVIGVDTVASAIRDARENARHNGVENARFVVGDAGAFMREMAEAGERVDVLLMDPPRSGASEEFLRSAAALAPERIVYISCDPRTQARDARLLADLGYRLDLVQPVDMFPHTDHIESVALLVREGESDA